MRTLRKMCKSQYRAWIVLTWFAAIAADGLLTCSFRLVYRWIFRPLRMLVKGSRRVAGGDFDYRIKLDSHDEMAELADAMNDMTNRFRGDSRRSGSASAGAHQASRAQRATGQRRLSGGRRGA